MGWCNASLEPIFYRSKPSSRSPDAFILLVPNSVRLCYGPLALNRLHEIKVVLLSLTGEHQSPSCRLWPPRDPQREQTLGRRGGQLPVQRRRLQHQRAQAEAQGWPEVAGNDHPPEADLRSRHQNRFVSEVIKSFEKWIEFLISLFVLIFFLVHLVYLKWKFLQF